jgi:hypothetical protein
LHKRCRPWSIKKCNPNISHHTILAPYCFSDFSESAGFSRFSQPKQAFTCEFGC